MTFLSPNASDLNFFDEANELLLRGEWIMHGEKVLKSLALMEGWHGGG